MPDFRSPDWQAQERWFTGAVGQRIIAVEQAWLSPWLERLFGYYLLHLSASPQALSLAASSIHTHLGASPVAVEDCPAVHCLRGICAEFDQLPLAADSVDVVTLHHALDYSRSPQQVLREATRVLMPYGHLLIMGWQPWGGVGVAQRLERLWQPAAFRQYQPVRVSRLMDWLHLLDFEVLELRHAMLVPPQWPERVQSLLQFAERLSGKTTLPLGSVYFICARKLVGGRVGGKPVLRKSTAVLPELAPVPLAGRGQAE